MMVVIVAVIVMQALVLPFFRCALAFDFSVDTVLAYSTYADGISVAAVPAVCAALGISLIVIVPIWIVLLCLIYAPVVLLDRTYMTDVTLLGLTQLVSLIGLVLAAITHLWWLAAAATAAISFIGVELLRYVSAEQRHTRGFERYVRHAYARLTHKYWSLVSGQLPKQGQRDLLFAVMVIENANTPLLYRSIEHIVQRFTKRAMTTGIMQVRAERWLSDQESIALAAKIVQEVWHGQSARALVHELAIAYNGDEGYSEALEGVLEVIEHS